jgi:ubiquinone/menaquinone biosynthesis C-methylase UbiE
VLKGSYVVMAAIAEKNLSSAYGRFAAYYDEFTADHDYDLWTSVVERIARWHGFDGSDLIDVACGTGKSFLPWARRGFQVLACDQSEQMLERARSKCEAEGLDVELRVADMRDMSLGRRASLVTCLDDALNYQLYGQELDESVASLGRLLVPDGVLVFDTNTTCTYTSSYATSKKVKRAGLTMGWEGRHVMDDVFEATITVDDRSSTLISVHRQRFWPQERVERALTCANLRLGGVYGMSRDGTVDLSPDDRQHTKFLFVATR